MNNSKYTPSKGKIYNVSDQMKSAWQVLSY